MMNNQPEYNFFRAVYKYSVNGLSIDKAAIIKKLNINEKEFKFLAKGYKQYYAEADTDYNNIVLNKAGLMYMRTSIIEKLKSRELPISPTSLKQFIKFGPNGLLKYYLKPKKQTEDMIWGIALETYILTPDLFEKEFAILDEANKPEPDKDYRNTKNKEWKNEFMESNADKHVISKTDYNLIKECNLQAGVTNDFLFDNMEGEKQITLTGDWKGLTISGVADLITEKKIYDLKKVQVATFDMVKWTIMREYLSQITTYWWIEGCQHQCSFFCIDLDANCIEVGISEQKLAAELENVKNYLNSLIRAIDGNHWDLGAEFHNGGRFIIW